jgi:hypothetical protein
MKKALPLLLTLAFDLLISILPHLAEWVATGS